VDNVCVVFVKVVELGFANFANNWKRRDDQRNVTMCAARPTVPKCNGIAYVRLCGQFRLQNCVAKYALVGDDKAANTQHAVLATKTTRSRAVCHEGLE
jgi:hypothetical protein